MWHLDATATATIQGRVFAGDTGQPLAGVQLQEYSGCYTGSGPICSSQRVFTTASGEFTLVVEAGTVLLQADSDYRDDYIAVSESSVQAVEGQTAAVVFYMERGGSASGVVTRSSDATRLSNVSVTFTDIQTGFMIGTSTYPDGHYELHKIKAGTYTANAQPIGGKLQPQWYAGHSLTPPSQGAQAADALQVVAGQEIQSVNFSLVDGGTLRGNVTDRFSVQPVHDTRLSLQFYDPASFAPWFSAYVLTDDAGNFQVDGLPPHALYLKVYGFSPYYTPYTYACGDSCFFDAATLLTPTPGGTLNVAFSLFPGSVISGTVTSRASGLPVAGAEVTLVAEGDPEPIVFATSNTDENGHYILTNFRAYQGSLLHVKVSGAHSGATVFLNQWYGGENCAIESCPLTGLEEDIPSVNGNVAAGIDLQLDQGAQIAGQAIPPATFSGPVDVYVELYAADGTLADAFFSGHDGTFESDGLIPGTYYLQAHPALGSGLSCTVYASASCSANAIPTIGQPITVAAAEHKTVTLQLGYEVIFTNGFD
jgi:hypothetical protein